MVQVGIGRRLDARVLSRTHGVQKVIFSRCTVKHLKYIFFFAIGGGVRFMSFPYTYHLLFANGPMNRVICVLVTPLIRVNSMPYQEEDTRRAENLQG